MKNTKKLSEFLLAIGENELVKLLSEKNIELIKVFKDKFISYLKEYYFVGGMPSAVNKYVESKDYMQVRKVQLKLLQAYEEDFSKHAPNEIVPRLKLLWHSIPANSLRKIKNLFMD